MTRVAAGFGKNPWHPAISEGGVKHENTNNDAPLQSGNSIAFGAVKSAANSATKPDSTPDQNHPVPSPQNASSTPASNSSQNYDEAKAKAGDTSDLPSPTEKAPKDLSVDDIKNLNGGLLKNLGNQDLQGKGGIRDLLSKDKNVNGDINTDKDAAWRAYRVLTAIKNEPNSDGNAKPDSVRHNGEIGGWTSQGFGHGSEGGDLQDYLLHGRVPSKLPVGDHTVGANGGTASGIENFGNTVREGFEKFGHDFVQGFKDFGKAVVDLGKKAWDGMKNFGHMVKNGFEGLGDWFKGDNKGAHDKWEQAKDNGKKLGHDIVDGAKDLGTIAETVAPLALNFVPGVGTAASAGIIAGETLLKTGLTTALKQGVSTVAKDVAKDAAKNIAHQAGESLYQDTTGQTPSETAKNISKKVSYA